MVRRIPAVTPGLGRKSAVKMNDRAQHPTRLRDRQPAAVGTRLQVGFPGSGFDNFLAATLYVAGGIPSVDHELSMLDDGRVIKE